MKTRCLIVDDEPLAIKLIENHISKIDMLTVVGSCNSAIKAFELLNELEIDLMFLDIKMPSMTGLDFMRTVKNPPKTIFTTAYREYAIESYDLEVVDYLLKPITFERFVKSIDRFLRLNEESTTTKEITVDDNEHIFIKSGVKHHRVAISTIDYIESTKDYIKLHLNTGQIIESKYRLGAIDEDLSGKGFMRVHRSYVINQKRIKAFTLHDIDVASTEIPIGASYRESVLLYLESLKA